jgi:hypothetical protein
LNLFTIQSMNAETQPSRLGRGSGGFRLGHGANATGGNLDVELHCIPATAAAVSIEWSAASDAVPAQARQQIISEIEGYLLGYLSRHPVGSFKVVIVGAGWFSDRRNEPIRATRVALHNAIIDAKLPPPLLFAPPDNA